MDISAIVAIVRNRSIWVDICRVIVPDGILVGHHAMAGSRNPPSNVVCLPHKNGPLRPASSFEVKAGPLSLVKNTN
ncbi:hypothetical protein BLA29_010188, partial [Euroglyphus maynei]